MSANPTDEKKTKPAGPETVKADAKGAFAPSGADSENNGALAIDPDGEKVQGSRPGHGRPETPERKSRD